MLAEDAYMLLSILNMRLRDEFASLDELCASLGEDREEIEARLGAIGYFYDEGENAFRAK